MTREEPLCLTMMLCGESYCHSVEPHSLEISANSIMGRGDRASCTVIRSYLCKKPTALGLCEKVVARLLRLCDCVLGSGNLRRRAMEPASKFRVALPTGSQNLVFDVLV